MKKLRVFTKSMTKPAFERRITASGIVVEAGIFLIQISEEKEAGVVVSVNAKRAADVRYQRKWLIAFEKPEKEER